MEALTKERLRLRVAFDPDVITLFKEVRYLDWLWREHGPRLSVPVAIRLRAEDVKEKYPYAVSLQAALRTYAQACDKVSEPVAHVEHYVLGQGWEVATTLPHVRFRLAAAEVRGSLYAFGGQGSLTHTSDGAEHPILATVDTYRPCSDGLRNGDEKGIDCGGSCKPCELPQLGDLGATSAARALALALALFA